MKTTERYYITATEANKLADEVYDNLVLREELAREAEARYWSFLYEEDDTVANFKVSFKQVLIGQTYPLDKLWEGIDAE